MSSQVARPLEAYPNLMEATVHSPETMDFELVCLLYGLLSVSLGMEQHPTHAMFLCCLPKDRALASFISKSLD